MFIMLYFYTVTTAYLLLTECTFKIVVRVWFVQQMLQLLPWKKWGRIAIIVALKGVHMLQACILLRSFTLKTTLPSARSH